VKIRTSTYA